jgi:hypothetical protein
MGKAGADVRREAEKARRTAGTRMRVPKILTTSFPEILATCR